MLHDPVTQRAAKTPQEVPVARELPTPYLLFLGNVTEAGYAKTAFGLKDWAPEKCVGEIALPQATVTTGLPAMTPREAAEQGARSLVIGIANAGGVIGPAWLPCLLDALDAGLDIVAGMHTRLADSVWVYPTV